MGVMATVLRQNRLGALGHAVNPAALAEDAGQRYGVDPSLILAVMQVESDFNPSAINPTDPSYGLMQVTPSTGSWMAGRPIAPDDLLDPTLNVDLGTRYLAYQLKRYGGDVAHAVNAYRAGTASDTPLSLAYVARVLGLYGTAGGPAAVPTPATLDTPSSGAETPWATVWDWLQADTHWAWVLGALVGVWWWRGRG